MRSATILAAALLLACAPAPSEGLAGPRVVPCFAAPAAPRTPPSCLSSARGVRCGLHSAPPRGGGRAGGRLRMQEQGGGKKEGEGGKAGKVVSGNFFAPEPPKTNIWGDVASRLVLPPLGMGAAALAGHHYLTGPLTHHYLTGLGMDIVEVGSFGLVGVVLGILGAFQFLVIDTQVLKNTVQKTVTAILNERADLKAGKGVENAVRSLAQSLRELPGIQGLIFRFALDMSGVFSEPGIVRLIEDVERGGGEEELKTGRRFSSLLSVAAEGAVSGRLDDFRLLMVACLVLFVGAFDAVVLFLDGLGS